jgi:hypothetical protein
VCKVCLLHCNEQFDRPRVPLQLEDLMLVVNVQD